MNKTVLFSVILAGMFVFLISFASAGYYPSYSDTYYKKVTYSPYGKTTEIHQDSPAKSMSYTATTRNYAYSTPYYNPVYSYWKYGPSYSGYYPGYYYRQNYDPYYGKYDYSKGYYDYRDYGYYRYGF